VGLYDYYLTTVSVFVHYKSNPVSSVGRGHVGSGHTIPRTLGSSPSGVSINVVSIDVVSINSNWILYEKNNTC